MHKLCIFFVHALHFLLMIWTTIGYFAPVLHLQSFIPIYGYYALIILFLARSYVMVSQKFIVQQEYFGKDCSRLSVKDRMGDMLNKIEEAGNDGIEVRELVKVFYDKWGFRLSTIKGYINDLEELELVNIMGNRVYHFNHQPPRGLVRSTR